MRMPLMRFTIVAAVALLAACASQPKSPAPPPPAPAPMAPAAIAEHVKVLASDAFEGRRPGTPGEEKTLAYIIAQFEAAGLKPGGAAGSWTQDVPLLASAVANAPALKIAARGREKEYAYGADQVIWTKREEARIALKNAPLVFVGYGVNAPERKWNDYARANIKGKIAVILVNDPDFYGAKHQLFGGKAMTYYGRWTYKFEEAARQGAAGALIVHETDPAAYGWGVVQSSNMGEKFGLAAADKGASRAPLEGWITHETAIDLFRRAGLDYEKLKAAAQLQGFRARPLNANVSVTLETTFRTVMSKNVVGAASGAGAPGETVIYTAHWDHFGRCPPVNGDDICNGARDNATGVAGLIEIARAYKAAPPTRRSIVFLAVTAEEQGLLGSEYYAQHLLFPPALTAANINMDILPIGGPSRDVAVVGKGKSTVEDVLAAEAAKQNRVVVGEATPERGSYFRSDHFNFAKIGVPALDAGAGEDKVDGGVALGHKLREDYVANFYHKPQDAYAPDWDLTGAAQDLALYYAVGRAVADTAVWPEWLPGAEFKALRDATAGERAAR
ncbi:MAG: M28 family metallopeptidase [Hyphomonadaceae bacterium]